MNKHLSWVLVGLALWCGCGKTYSTGNDSNGMSALSVKIPAAPAGGAEDSNMTVQAPQGSWRSSVALEYPLKVTPSGDGFAVEWAPTIDRDIEISGVLTGEGAKNVLRGDVHLLAGDEERDAPMTLRFDAATQTLSMEFAAMFEEPIVFNRVAAEELPGSCAMAEDILAGTEAFKKLEATHSDLKITDEVEAEGGRLCDLRVFVEGDDGEILTVDRFRVDFSAKQVLKYDPVEDTYAPSPGSSGLFNN